MMTILHYYPSNNRSVAFESYLSLLRDRGYNVIVLTTAPRGSFHTHLENNGIACYSISVNSKIKILYYLKQIRYLIQFCNRHKVDFVFSHLQHANIIAVMAQNWLSAKVIIFRHHLNNSKIESPNNTEKLFDKIINRKAKTIIVASESVKRKILLDEKINDQKLHVIPYIYDFSLYNIPDPDLIQEIKNKYKCKLLLLSCSRFVDSKRHGLLLELMKKWIYEDRLDIQLVLLDQGPLFESIKQMSTKFSLDRYIHFIGFTNCQMEYMSAADVLIHPSLSETSSSTVKEVGIMSKTAIVCKNVGDFEDYIVDQENGFIVSDLNTFTEMDECIRKIYLRKDKLIEMGEKLKITINRKFGLNSNTIELYEKLIKNEKYR